MNHSSVSMIIKSQLIIWKKENFLSKLKNKCPDDEQIERTKDIIKLFNIKNGEDLTELYLKSIFNS